MNKILVLKNGCAFLISGENSKYYFCGNTQFRKSNPMIAEIKEEIPAEVPEEEWKDVSYEEEVKAVESTAEEPVAQEEKPKRKRTSKKKVEEEKGQQ